MIISYLESLLRQKKVEDFSFPNIVPKSFWKKKQGLALDDIV